MASDLRIPAGRAVVVMPNWLGDGVMATQFLRGLRGLYAGAEIVAVARPRVAPVVEGLAFVDRVVVMKKGEEGKVVGELQAFGADLGVLLPNSFRSAWMMWRAGIPARVGYARDWRGPLLTHRLEPVKRTPEQRALDAGKEKSIRRIGRELRRPAHAKVGSAFQPVPTVDYYLEVARFLGAGECDRQMRLGVTGEEQAEADSALAMAGIGAGENVVVMVPGANFGSSKCWEPGRFAQVADRLMDRQGVCGGHVILATSPAEMGIAEAILAASALCPGGKGIGRLHMTATLNGGKALSIGALKAVVKRSTLMVCNDTGPRHFAAAFGVPTVTLFGPTDPVWAETFSSKERIVRVEVPCGPCQLKRCPIDHRCMKGITVEAVMAAVAELLRKPEVVEEDVDPRSLERM
ncbi:MAG: glycosyltransferase family 9 protein [Phycisphaerae bacterium]